METHGVSGRVLDYGAGRGHLLQALNRRFPRLELSAFETAPAAATHLRSLPFLRAVYEAALDHEHAGFHAIVASEVLEHIEDHDAALSELVGALRPGGRLYLTVPLHPAHWTLVDDAVGHVRRYEVGQLAAMCEARGLTIDADRAVGFPFYNAYYRLLGRKTPQESAARLHSPVTRLASYGVAALFELESVWSHPRGTRGIVVARKPLPDGSRGR